MSSSSSRIIDTMVCTCTCGYEPTLCAPTTLSIGRMDQTLANHFQTTKCAVHSKVSPPAPVPAHIRRQPPPPVKQSTHHLNIQTSFQTAISEIPISQCVNVLVQCLQCPTGILNVHVHPSMLTCLAITMHGGHEGHPLRITIPSVGYDVTMNRNEITHHH